jgi:iron complex outermembrane receptor protein
LLTDNLSVAEYKHGIDQARIAIDGPLFALPGGPIRVAAGAEYLRYMAKITRSRSNNTGPASRGSEQLKLNLGRNVKSAFGEALLPFVSEDNAVPLIRNLNVTISGRYDDYSDVGSTFNPKIGGNWEMFDGLRFRGNWSQSFVAPAISSLGDASRQGLATFSGYGNNGGSIIIPLASYPLARQIPTCNAPGQVTCTISNAAIPGISYNNGNPTLKPQTGEGWSAGFDLSPPQISGLKIGVTLFNASFRGGVTSPNLATVINTPGLNYLLTFYPNGATPAEIKAIVGEAPLNGPLPSPVYFIRNGQQQNVVNLDIQGLDANIDYRIETDSMGTFSAGAAVSRFLKFDQNIGGGPWFSVLNTTGFNETFPSIETQARFSMGWEAGWFSADLFANYIGAYNNWSTTTVAPLTRDANGNPNGGGDPVDSSTLWDLHLSADLPKVIGSNTQVYVDVTNLTDKEPTFYNSASGYDGYGANPIGRVISVGARLRF